MLGMALLFTLYSTLTPASIHISTLDHADKIAHAVAFLGLSFLLDAGWSETDFNWRKYLPLFLLGVVIECIQYFIPERSFSLLDMLADGAGIALYGLVFLPILKKINIR